MGDGENDVLKLDLTNQLASTLALTVQKGDVIDLGVWAYTDIDYNSFGNSSGQTALTGMIASAFGGISGGIGEAGSIYSGIEQGLAGFGESPKTDGTPSAHLNFLLFDKDFTPVNGGFAGITASGVQQYLTFTPLTIDESGYIFIFLTFGNDAGRVFFDDMKVEHTKNSKIVQQDDYYPFGLSFNSWQRGGSKKNDYLYNGFEEQTELEWGVFDYQARYYDPAIGRFLQVDPMADVARRNGVYNYAYNNPLRYIDPDGMVATDTTKTDSGNDSNTDENENKSQYEVWLEENELEDTDENFNTFAKGIQNEGRSLPSDNTSTSRVNSSSDPKRLKPNQITPELIINLASQGYDVLDLLNKSTNLNLQLPSGIGHGLSLLSIGSKIYKKDETGVWIEVSKVVLGRLVGGYTVLALELFIAVGRDGAYKYAVKDQALAQIYYHNSNILRNKGQYYASDRYYKRAKRLDEQSKKVFKYYYKR